MRTKNWMKWPLALAAAWWGLVSACDAQAELTIGSKAPSIDIEHWISNGDGHFKPVKKFEDGKVYVVEFWATWCGPCVASMPHIVKIQKDYLDKGVQFISVSDEDLETVETFLEREVPERIAKSLHQDAEGEDPNAEESESDEALTFAKLTSAYCLTADPDRSVHQDYFEAAGERGIPCAFIVGKTGEIEWIGHPMRMEKPLADIVANKWDREAFAQKRAAEKEEEEKEQAEQRELQAEMQKYQGELQGVIASLQKGDYEDGLEKLEGIIERAKDSPVLPQLETLKLQVMLRSKPEVATQALVHALESVDDVQILNAIAWSIYERTQGEEGEEGEKLPKDMVEAAYKVAEKAVKLAPKDGSVFDTLAHLAYLKGDRKQALELQTKAVELAPDVDELKEFLDLLKKEAGEK